MLGLVLAGQRRDDLRLRGAAPCVPMGGEALRIARARHDVADDAEAGHAGDLVHHLGEQQVHLQQRLLHAWV
jgi:hypothetical protein